METKQDENDSKQNDQDTKNNDNDDDDDDGKSKALMVALPDTQKSMVENAEYLERAALSKINAVEKMRDELIKTGTDTSFILCETVEYGCRDIVSAHANISKSLMLIESLAKLKPANMTDEGKQLWDAIDAGVVNIIGAALNVSKITYQYFAYFIKFRQS